MTDNFILISIKRKIIKLPAAEIIYIEALDDYIKIMLQNSEPVICRMTLTAILKELEAEKFIRVHRSFAVAIDKVDRISAKAITVNAVEIPIGRTYKVMVATIFKRISAA